MEKQHYYKARKRVKKVKEFYSHLFTYVVISIFLVALNVFTMWGDSHFFFWAAFPILGWGLGVIFHGFDVFGFGKNWEEKRILAEMQKIEDAEEARAWLLERQQNNDTELPPLDAEDEELELKEFRKLRKEWDDQEYV